MVTGSWRGYKNYDHYFWINPPVPETGGMIEWYNETVESGYEIIGDRKKYINVPASFDIETSSWTSFNVKYATMYVWSFCLNGSTILGRTWGEFVKLLAFLKKHLHTDKHKLIIYVHNLGYEFQFMRGWLNWEEVFAVKERRPVHASVVGGIEFKCSYLLSNYALSYIGANLLHTYPVQKAVGDLDYSLIRHSGTGLTQDEIWYSVKDVQVVSSYIQEKIENEGGINKIPLTNTGYVRNYCREFCFTQHAQDPKLARKYSARYHDRMKSLEITSKCEYDQLHDAFAGGFTHTAPKHSGILLEGVGSADEASAYPGEMVRKKFPMSRGIFIGNCSQKEIDFLISKGHCVLFTVKLYNVSPKFVWENYISISRCSEVSQDVVVNNGRVAAAEYLQLTVTEQDWDIIKRCYEWDKAEFYSCRYYYADYLPRPFILSILKLYANKTSLKGVEGRETEYMVSKNMINATYGMSVTNIIRDIFEYSSENDWSTEKADVSTQLKSYNNNHNRFLFYAWGVWVTAHARHDLWEAIFEFGPDYVYADTDSIKGINFEKHKAFFTLYNNNVEVQLAKMSRIMKIPLSLCKPKTKKGKTKTIGIWEMEEGYKQFKAIGAKRYMYEYEDGSLSFTISGVNKKFGVPYLLKEYTGVDPSLYNLIDLAYSPDPRLATDQKVAMGTLCELHNKGEISYDKIFEAFSEGLYFPPEATGKQTLTYIDEPKSFKCTDFNGVTRTCFEYSCIHMEPQSYYLSQADEYKRFLLGFRDASI